MSDEVLVSEMAGCVALPRVCILQASAAAVCVEPCRLGLGSYLNLVSRQVLSRSVWSRVDLNLVSARGCVEACYYGLLLSLAGYR